VKEYLSYTICWDTLTSLNSVYVDLMKKAIWDAMRRLLHADLRPLTG